MSPRIGLLLESDGPGGAEQTVLHLGEELRRRGHEVVHVGPARGSGWLGGEFERRGFATRGISPRAPLDPAFLGTLRRLIRTERLDVVHSHEFTMAVYGAIAARLERRRHVITLHGGTRLTAALRRRIAVRMALELSAAMVAVSESWRKELARALRVQPSRIAVVPNGVPPRPGDRETTRTTLGIRTNELMILAVGNLEPWKGHRFLLEAAAGLPPSVRVVIAGGRGGPEATVLEKLAASDPLRGRVQILLHRTDVPDLLAASDLFVMPSTFEGLPLAVLEAMFAARPVVASRVGGIPEAVRDGEEGLLVPPADPAALAAALRRLLLDPPLRQRLGRAGRARAEARFTVQAMTDRYERLYRGSPG